MCYILFGLKFKYQQYWDSAQLKWLLHIPHYKNSSSKMKREHPFGFSLQGYCSFQSSNKRVDPSKVLNKVTDVHHVPVVSLSLGKKSVWFISTQTCSNVQWVYVKEHEIRETYLVLKQGSNVSITLSPCGKALPRLVSFRAEVLCGHNYLYSENFGHTVVMSCDLHPRYLPLGYPGHMPPRAIR